MIVSKICAEAVVRNSGGRCFGIAQTGSASPQNFRDTKLCFVPPHAIVPVNADRAVEVEHVVAFARADSAEPVVAFSLAALVACVVVACAALARAASVDELAQPASLAEFSAAAVLVENVQRKVAAAVSPGGACCFAVSCFGTGCECCTGCVFCCGVAFAGGASCFCCSCFGGAFSCCFSSPRWANALAEAPANNITATTDVPITLDSFNVGSLHHDSC